MSRVRGGRPRLLHHALWVVLALLMAPAVSADISQDLEDLEYYCNEASAPFDKGGVLLTRTSATSLASDIGSAASSLAGSAGANDRVALVTGINLVECSANALAHRYGFSDIAKTVHSNVLTMMTKYQSLFPSSNADAAVAGGAARDSSASSLPVNSSEGQAPAAGNPNLVEAAPYTP